MSESILQAQHLSRHYPIRSTRRLGKKRVVQAVSNVSLTIYTGEIFGLVGESGCGKSTLGRLLLHLEAPTKGRVHFKGRDLDDLSPAQLKAFRRQAQIIYQDPYSALNPRQQVGRIITEPLDIHRVGSAAQRRERMQWLMEKVGLRPGQAQRYPHEFSGGQRQRIVIARALALNPELILADEPVSALDVSVQAQVINLLYGLKRELNLTYVFISHDLTVIEHISDRIGVMYLGKIVELAPKAAFYQNPLHPYAQALLSAAPVPQPGAVKRRILLTGDVPSPIDPPPGCAFHPRCPAVRPRCRQETPLLEKKAADHWAACWEVAQT
jgi:oligopeptide/dipeptide ABC transporter ATP-binding protein